MKITITIEDHESGRVEVHSDPHMRTLAAMARDKSRELTPAAGYALGALAKIVKDSQAQTQEDVKSKFELGMIPAQQSKRQMFH